MKFFSKLVFVILMSFGPFGDHTAVMFTYSFDCRRRYIIPHISPNLTFLSHVWRSSFVILSSMFSCFIFYVFIFIFWCRLRISHHRFLTGICEAWTSSLIKDLTTLNAQSSLWQQKPIPRLKEASLRSEARA